MSVVLLYIRCDGGTLFEYVVVFGVRFACSASSH